MASHGYGRGRGHGIGHGGPPRLRARRGAVKCSIMQLLSERPMHGYELINELEQRTGGHWRPSAGSVYPTLTQLEDEGLVSSTESDGRRQYDLTDDGKAWLDEHQGDSTPPWERRGFSEGHGEIRRLAAETAGQLRQIGRFGTPDQVAAAAGILRGVRADLYAILANPPDDTDEADTPIS